MKGFTGRVSSLVSAEPPFFGGRGASRLAGAGRSRTRRPTAGNSSKKFKAHGDEEYTVVAQSVAVQLRRKSIRQAAGVYGMNNRSRCCITDHNSMLNYNVVSQNLHSEKQCVYGTGIASATLFTSATELPV